MSDAGLDALADLAAKLTDEGHPPTLVRAAVRDGIRRSQDRCGAFAGSGGGHGGACVKPREHEGVHEDRDGWTWARVEGWVKA